MLGFPPLASAPLGDDGVVAVGVTLNAPSVDISFAAVSPFISTSALVVSLVHLVFLVPEVTRGLRVLEALVEQFLRHTAGALIKTADYTAVLVLVFLAMAVLEKPAAMAAQGTETLTVITELVEAVAGLVVCAAAPPHEAAVAE